MAGSTSVRACHGENRMIKVLLVDDQALVRTGFRLILDEADDIEVIGEASDGRHAVQRAQELRPDVILMDVRMPVMDGIQATAQIQTQTVRDATTPKVIILTTFDLDEYVDAALRAGASGFLLKDALAVDVLSAIRTIVSGDAVLAPSATRRLIERYVATPRKADRPEHPNLDTLTPREHEVVLLIAAGLSNAEIASRLFLSEGTVKAHVSRILTKLHLRDRVQVVILAYDIGLTQPGS